MLLGCATEPPISEARWRAEKEYEQQGARDDVALVILATRGPLRGSEGRAHRVSAGDL